MKSASAYKRASAYDQCVPGSLSTEEHARWWKEAGGWQLRQLLFWQWDPIGVNEAFPWSYDEYDNYAGPIVTQLGSGADAMEIARYLDRVATVNMGLGVSAGRSETGPSSDLVDLAQRIVDWYPSSIEWWRSWSR
jgi:hypothetical protein